LTLLLDNGLTARNVFLPYLNPVQRAIAAASAGDEADPNYFELLADPVGFLEGRGVENIIFVSGGEDDRERSNEQDNPPFEPSDEGGDSPNLGDMEDDSEGKSHFHRSEESKLPPPSGELSQGKRPFGAPQTEGAEDSRPEQKANLHFKSDRLPLRLTRCWQGKFFHRDDMLLPVNAISGALDFTIRPGDSNSVQRYKKFLADVHGRFGTLDPGRLVMAIRDETDRKNLKECYHHIRGVHNDVSLVLWHGPIQTPALARVTAVARTNGWPRAARSLGCNGGTLLTGDLTCKDRVVQNMDRHFGWRLRESAILQVPHHGSAHSWNSKLLDVTSRSILPVIIAGARNGYHHPDLEVIDSLDNWNGGVRWFRSDERSPVFMRIETL
jgi:hypothetical protein